MHGKAANDSSQRQKKSLPDSSDNEAFAAGEANPGSSPAMRLRRKPSALGANSTAARGYGGAHQQTRKALEPVVAAGGVLCSRCQRPILPGQAWDLGHSDYDRNVYTGAEHQACNRVAA